MRPGKRRSLPDTPDGKLQDLIETAKAHIRSKVEHPFRVIKQQFGFQKTRLRGLAKNRCKINVLAAMSNLFQARRHFLRQPDKGPGVSEHLDSASKPAQSGGTGDQKSPGNGLRCNSRPKALFLAYYRHSIPVCPEIP